VLRRLVDGEDNRQIADALHVGLGTVKADVSRILDKLRVDNRVAAAVSAVRHGLV
jgi:DNA-binding NarL/FixJ family response regulator